MKKKKGDWHQNKIKKNTNYRNAFDYVMNDVIQLNHDHNIYIMEYKYYDLLQLFIKKYCMCGVACC